MQPCAGAQGQGGPGGGACNQRWFARMYLEFFIGGGANPEAMYNLCFVLKLCYKNHVITVTLHCLKLHLYKCLHNKDQQDALFFPDLFQ
jgi:hypothetical protein